MIRIFGKTDTSFLTNGDAVIRPLKAKVRKEDNGNYYLDLEAGLEYAEWFEDGRIVVADLPQGDQAFRISNPTKTKTKVTSRAWHVFFDSENYLIVDSYVVNKDGAGAMNHLNRATEPESPFTVYSDVTASDSYRCVRKSLYEAFSMVVDRWGGHLVRDNFSVGLMTTIGRDNGVTVRYKKNLKDITCEENWNAVVTKLLPVGKDGILLNALDPAVDIFVTSEIHYPIPYTKTVSFSQSEIKEDDFKDAEGNLDETAYKQALIDDLYLQAVKYLDVNSVPQVNYTLKANLEKLTDVGDTVEVIDERLGVDIMTNVIAFEYDCLLKTYTIVEFGNFKNSLSGLVSNVTASVDKTVTDQVQAAAGVAVEGVQRETNNIRSVLGDSFVIFTGDQILIVDSLPKETACRVIRIDNRGVGFSATGIDGPFTTAWGIDGTMNMASFSVLNLTADLIKGGTLALGSHDDAGGRLMLYDGDNAVICQMDKGGLKLYGKDGSYLIGNVSDGLVGYDRNGNEIFRFAGDSVSVSKASFENEITTFRKFRIVPMTVTDSDGVHDGVGFVSFGGDNV